RDLIRLVVKRIPDPWLGGILLGFYSRARELKVEVVIDPDSRLMRLPDHLPRQYLGSILGNLITNAFEAVENRSVWRRRKSWRKKWEDISPLNGASWAEPSFPSACPKLGRAVSGKGGKSE